MPWEREETDTQSVSSAPSKSAEESFRDRLNERMKGRFPRCVAEPMKAEQERQNAALAKRIENDERDWFPQRKETQHANSRAFEQKWGLH
jgi:hypothetical protein